MRRSAPRPLCAPQVRALPSLRKELATAKQELAGLRAVAAAAPARATTADLLAAARSLPPPSSAGEGGETSTTSTMQPSAAMEAQVAELREQLHEVRQRNARLQAAAAGERDTEIATAAAEAEMKASSAEAEVASALQAAQAAAVRVEHLQAELASERARTSALEASSAEIASRSRDLELELERRNKFLRISKEKVLSLNAERETLRAQVNELAQLGGTVSTSSQVTVLQQTLAQRENELKGLRRLLEEKHEAHEREQQAVATAFYDLSLELEQTRAGGEGAG